jgi:replicative DNA helicase
MMLNNYEAEAAVLGSVLHDGTLIKNLMLEETHFHDRRHKLIFRAMKQAEERDEFIDMVVVTSYMGKAIYQVGGTSYLLELAGSVATTANLAHHEELVFQAYRLRKTREAAIRYSESPSLEHLDKLISSLQVYREAGSVEESKTIYDYLLEITEEMTLPQPEEKSCMTSFAHLDNMTGGLQRGELLIVAARPSVGKTAFALNLAAEHCNQAGAAQIFSLEMGTKSLLKRMISREGMINGQKWRSMAFSAADYEQAMMAIDEISRWKLAVYDKKRTVRDIHAAIRKHVMDDPDGDHLVIIDYLQLIMAERRERRDLEVGEITRELKLLSIELNIPIVLLSQLSRGVESRQNKRPLMSDLRESGNIEQDADVIFFLYRDDYYDADAEKAAGNMEVIISKQRNGPTGTVELGFQKEYGRFVDAGNGK